MLADQLPFSSFKLGSRPQSEIRELSFHFPRYRLLAKPERGSVLNLAGKKDIFSSLLDVILERGTNSRTFIFRFFFVTVLA